MTLAVAAVTTSLVPAASAQAATPKPRAYTSCASLNAVYKHGVGRPGAKDKVSGRTAAVRTFTVDKKTYDLNARRLDRDKDGIACEKG